MSQSFFKKFITDLGDSDTAIAADGTSSAEFGKFIDSGSYVLNAALCGDMFGGFPDNKALVLAGESTTGKTFFALSLVRNFLEENPTGQILYFDTESAITNQMFKSRGIDPDRIAKSEPDSIEKFRTVAVRALDKYMEIPEDKRFPMLMVLDSLSALPSKKETEDITNEKDVRDMTKSQLIKGAFRVLRLKLAKAKVPLIVTAHTYAVIGCLTDSASILMSDGTTKNIRDIAVGDMVQTLEGSHPVTDLYQYEVEDTYDIEFEDGTIISATPNHKFMTADGRWVRADELLVTDEIRVVNFSRKVSMKIKSIRRNHAAATVYDFTVKDVHHYLLNNGVVSHNSYVPTREIAGGGGTKYAADTIAFLSKSKDRDSDKNVIGNIVKVRMVKSRMTKEETVIETRILFDGGLDRYYGLLDYAQEAGIVSRVGNKYEFPNGTKAFENAVLTNPEKFFTQDILERMNTHMKERFLYTGEPTVDVSELEEVAE